MEYEEEDYCQFHIPEIRQTASSMQWRSEVDGLFLMVSLMQYDMHVISACAYFFYLMRLSVRVHLSLSFQIQ